MQDNLLIDMSAVADGSMSKAVDDDERRHNRQKYLEKHGISIEQSVLVCLKYEGDNYRRYYTVGSDQAGDGMTYESSVVSDGLFTQNKNLALFLPVADCIGAVLYDPVHQILGLGHLGRHNLLQVGGTGLVEYMVNEFGSNASDIEVWLSPAAGRENYPLYDFANRSMHEVATEQLLAGGVNANSILLDNRDTTTNQALFSHSEFLKFNRSLDGRQAVVAMIKL